MALFTNVKTNLSGLFKGLKGLGEQFIVPQTPPLPQQRPDSYSSVGRRNSYREIMSGQPHTPNRETIDAILAKVLDLPHPPPPVKA